MATPFVTGSAALLMEWGIVRENDPYLYGERMKGYLHRGARRLQGYDRYPNDEIGYGGNLLLHSGENDDVCIHRHANGKNDTGNSR